MPTFNRGQGLLRFVEPLLEDPFPLEIIVVVDGSRDGSIEALEGLAERDPRLKSIWIENSGEMGARGAGVAQASAEIVLMLDDDVLASPGLAREHARWHATRKHLVVVGYMPTVLPDPQTARDYATSLYAREYERACRRYEREPKQILYNLWAGNVSLRRADAIAIGMANPAYTIRYHQDMELGLRCIKAGMEGVFDPMLRAKHLHSRGLEAFRREALAQGTGRRRLHALHADLLGPLQDDEIRRGLPPGLRLVTQASRRPRAYRTVTGWLVKVIRVAEQAGACRVATVAARLLRRLDQEHGMFATSIDSQSRI